jgi:anti-sigma B factor antagonist
MPAPLNVTQRMANGVAILELHGRLVFEDGDERLRSAVNDLIVAGQLAVLIDLHDVSYMDSAGIGAVVEAFLRLTHRGGQCRILRPSKCVQRVLDITRLSTVIDTFTDEAAALRTYDRVHA